ncbi:hypothetical protein D3C86_1405170 [compost metagenome]
MSIEYCGSGVSNITDADHSCFPSLIGQHRSYAGQWFTVYIDSNCAVIYFLPYSDCRTPSSGVGIVRIQCLGL